MSAPTACDQCFKRKKRCHFDPPSTRCVRCTTSSLACTKLRRQGRTGRPPNTGPVCEQGAFHVWDSNSAAEQANAAQPCSPARMTPSRPSIDLVRQNNIEESPLLPDLTDESFYAALDIWMFGSTFAHDFHRAIDYCHQSSPWLLHEMFIAMDTFLDWARFNRITSERVDIVRGARSLQKLRTAEITGPQDALAILMLGQTLAAFDAFMTCVGATFILRYSLSLIRPWYPGFAQVQFLDPVTISPIFWDIAGCLVYRELPVIRPIWRGKPVIDRLAGLCTSLLPTLHDLCVIGHEMRSGPLQARRLETIAEQVRRWKPTDDDLESLGFSAIEIASMRTQAVLYQIATRLLIHRLRHPLMSQDGTAVALATEILEERTKFFASQGDQATLQNAGLPIFLALLEVPLPPEEFWKTSTRLRVRPVYVDSLIFFYDYYWEERRLGFSGSLFELVDRGPKIVIFP